MACFTILLTLLSVTDPTAWREATVEYVSGSTFYLDAGRDEGLEVGHDVELVEGEKVLGTMRVVYVARHRAACELVTEGLAVASGAVVRFLPLAVPESEAVASLDPVVVDRTPNQDWGIGGRLAVRYFASQDDRSGRTDLTRPSFDVRLEGRNLRDTGWDATVDVRARRTSRTGTEGTSSLDQIALVYRLNAGYAFAAGRGKVTLGRQFALDIPNLGAFDGLQASFGGNRWQVGGVSGFQPTPVDLSPRLSLQQHGGFAQFRSPDRSERHYRAGLAAVGSYQDGSINREYIALSGSYHGRRLTLRGSQEIDLMRGWRAEGDKPLASFTSSVLRTGFRFGGGVALGVGLDTRSTVRLYRDRETPETEFDDRSRQGQWAEMSVPARGFTLSLRGSRNSGSSDFQSTGFRFQSPSLSSWRARVWGRATHYRAEFSDGWINSLGARLPIRDLATVAVSGGTQRDEPTSLGLMRTASTWGEIDIDVALGSSWYLAISLERDVGDDRRSTAHSSLVYRF